MPQEYKIKKGDTLGAIAKKYNISVSELATVNKISNPNKIKEGITISIPEKKKEFSKKELIKVYKENKPIYDTKDLYQGLDTSNIDNEKVVMDYMKGREPFILVDKKTNTLRRFDERGNEVASFRVGLGKDKGDKFTINSKNKKVDRNTSSAGIYIVDEQDRKKESYKHDYEDNILLLKSEAGLRQAMSIHQTPRTSKKNRDAKLLNLDLTDDDFSNGCINCTKEQYEQYLEVVKPGQKVIVLPEEEGNYFTVKGDKLSFTTNRNKEYGQYNYTPKNKEISPFNLVSINSSDYKNQYLNALSNEKEKLMKDLNLSNEEYDQLAKRAYGIFGQESSFGEGSWNPAHNYKLEQLYTTLLDKPEERKNRSLGLTQVRLKHVNPDIAKKYGIDEQSLYYPYQAAVATMERLADSLQMVKNPKVRDRYKGMSPENVYDYAVTAYNKPETVRLGKASGNNQYVQQVKQFYSELEPENKSNRLIANKKQGGTINELGYKKDSPYKEKPFIDIYSNLITMDGVDKDLLLIPDKGKPVMAKANSGEYKFPNASQVKEIPLYQQGGQINSNQVKKFDREKLKAVQLDLKSKGLYKGKIDGIYGKKTQQAIDYYNKNKSIESDYKLTVTDSYGSQTTSPGEKEKYFNPPKLPLKGENYLLNFIYDNLELLNNPLTKPLLQNQLEEKMKTSSGAQYISDFNTQNKSENYTGSNKGKYNLVSQYVYGNQNIPLSKYKPKSDYLEFLPSYSLKDSSINLEELYTSFLQEYAMDKFKDKDFQTSEEAIEYGRKEIDKKIKDKEPVYMTTKSPLVASKYGYNLGSYKVGIGYDEKTESPYLSISDAWDFEPTHYTSKWGNSNPEYYQQAYLAHKLGKPFKIYDRFYLDEMKKGKEEYQVGGVSKKPVSPFMDLKPFINTYKMKGDMFQDGGILEDYIRTLPEEQQPDFVNEFAALEPEAQREVIQFMKGGYYQMGGKLSEVEGGETAVTPDSELVKFKGKKHKHGGIKIDLPGGTRIYSEHLKVPTELAEQVLGKKVKDKMSYADISKKFPTKPYLDILKESDDKYKRESAQIKLMNNLAKLDTLFYAQEQVKEYDLQENFQAGGEVDWTTGMFPTEEYQTQYPTIHTEPSPTVSTGVVLNLRNPKIDPTYDLTLPEDTVKSTPIKVGSKQPKQRSKPNANPVVADSDLLEIPLPFGQLPTTDVRTRQVTSMGEVDDEGVVVKDSEVNTDDVNYPGSKRTKREFGLSSKLTGTIADIGLALSDKLRVSEPTLYDRRKYPLFTRYVDFDDKEVGKMFNQNIDQIQKSQLPEQVKQAQITELLGKYKDYQSKVDFTNLQRYEQKRERDTDKLQSYMDTNIDIKVSDLDNYRQRKARVNELRDTFNAQRKSRVVNSLKAYADYVDKINYTNQMIPNYSVNPVTGRIDYKANQQSNLTQDILNKYSKNANNKVNLGNGLTGVVMGGKMVVTNADGSKFEVVNLEQ